MERSGGHKVTDLDAINEELASSLSLGCFPRNVASYELLLSPLEQLVFLDYLINSLCGVDSIRTSPGEQILNEPQAKFHDTSLLKLKAVLDQLESTALGEVNVYRVAVIAHWHYFVGNLQKVKDLISPIDLTTTPASDVPAIAQLLSYSQLRLLVLKGLSDDLDRAVWAQYLSRRRLGFTMSEIASREWLTLLFSSLASQGVAGVKKALNFAEFKALPFVSNQLSAIEFGCYLLTKDGQKFIGDDFTAQFKSLVSAQIETSMKEKHLFPHAESTSNELEGLIGAISIASSTVDFDVVDPKLVHSALINFSSKTYQSHVVMSRLVESLARRGNYDEALAAFGAYVGYLQNDEEQHGGRICNIVSTIHAYTVFFSQFNPASVSGAHLKPAAEKLRYCSESECVEILKQNSNEFVRYLGVLGAQTGLEILYDDKQPLSFLAPRATIIPPSLRDLVAKAWLSLGQFSQYIASRRCLTRELLDANTALLLERYHAGLSYNDSGNLVLLHLYACALAHERQLDSALKLCKHTLKLFPHSFKTWNLLVLIMLALEQTSRSNGQTPIQDASKWINSALNVASLYLTEARERGIAVPNNTKKDILELKLTESAVREQTHGTRLAMEQAPLVFVFFDELYEEHANVARPDMMDYVAEKSLNAQHQKTAGHKKFHDKRQSLVAKMLRHSISNLTRYKSRTSKHPTEGDHGNAKTRTTDSQTASKELLQCLWLWLGKMYMREQMLEECEHCIVEAESALEPNLSTFNALALLVAGTRSQLAKQEYERVLELNGIRPLYTAQHGDAIVGLSRLFLEGDSKSLFISERDETCGILRVKNLLEQYLLSWLDGAGRSEVWFYLSKIYEKLGDADLMSAALWRCVDLEDSRPVRNFTVALLDY